MTRRRHLKFLTLVTVCVLFFSAAGLSACTYRASTTPTTEPAPAVTEEKTALPAEEVVAEEKPVVTEETTVPPEEKVIIEEPTPQQESAPQQELTSIKIDISDFSFAPATVTVPVGTTITWTNKDSVAHTVSSRDNLFDSGNLPTGATFSYTFSQNGTSQYYCKIHPSMTGKVIAGEEEVAPTGEETAPPKGDADLNY